MHILIIVSYTEGKNYAIVCSMYDTSRWKSVMSSERDVNAEG